MVLNVCVDMGLTCLHTLGKQVELSVEVLAIFWSIVGKLVAYHCLSSGKLFAESSQIVFKLLANNWDPLIFSLNDSWGIKESRNSSGISN